MLNSPENDDDAMDRALAARLSGLLTLLVLRRFILRLCFFLAFAFWQAAFGFGFMRQIALLTLLSATISAALGCWRRERWDAGHLTAYDEAAWFVLIGCVASRLS